MTLCEKVSFNSMKNKKANSTFLNHKKFNSHKEYSIRFFSQISPRITLCDTLRETLQELLMWIDLDDEESKPMIIDITNNKGKPRRKQRNCIPTFNLYRKEVGDGTGNKWIATFVYEIRNSPDNATMLKNLLCKYPLNLLMTWNLFPTDLILLQKRNYAWNRNSIKRIS